MTITLLIEMDAQVYVKSNNNMSVFRTIILLPIQFVILMERY